MLRFSFVLLGACYFAATISMSKAAIKPAEFFNITDGNLTKITWAHAVNNQSYLTDALADNKIMMLEADIVIGKLNGEGDDIPIMGHPPADVSDLSLEQFLLQTSKSTGKGIKLDFKSLEALQKAVTDLELYKNANYPIFLNADILRGPVIGSNPVDATGFLTVGKQFEEFVLSLGWTTNLPNEEGQYSEDIINQMIDVITTNQVTQSITFPVRACFAAESFDQMKHLLDSVEGSTLTIWGSEGDSVNETNLADLIEKIGAEKIYVDLPKSADDDGNSANVFSTSPFKMMLAVFIGLVIKMFAML